jgi:cellulose synthase (UDP-forming)
MSLLTSRKFWVTKMRWRTRCCFLSGFCYYVHTAVFTFAAPLIPLTMMLFMPGRVELINYVFILPSIIYNFAVFPAWHRCQFGPTAYMAKLLYGWAHVFAIWDTIRGHRMGWQTTGGSKRKSGIRRIWIGIAAWNGTTCAVWVLLALWRASQFGIKNFSVLLFGGIFASAITAMALGSRRNYVRTLQGVGNEAS